MVSRILSRRAQIFKGEVLWYAKFDSIQLVTSIPSSKKTTNGGCLRPPGPCIQKCDILIDVSPDSIFYSNYIEID